MRLLIIAPPQIPVPPAVGGSVENCIYQIARRMATNHRITVACRQSGGQSAAASRGNLHFVRVPRGSAAAYLKAIRRRLRGQRFDMIQIDNRPSYVPIVRKLFPGIPISVFLHSPTFITPPSSSVGRAAVHLSGATLIVANSRALAGQLKAMFPRLKSRIRHVLLGADLSQFRPPTEHERSRTRSGYGLSGSFNIVFAGRLIPKKGVPVLIRAARLVRQQVPSAKLVIAGGAGKPGYVSGLKRLAAVNQVPLKFMGYVPRLRMHEVYWVGDCFVCPSQWKEPFGLVNAEAMAAGTPVVASRIGGIPEIISHGDTGLLVSRYRSPSAFAGQILKLARDRGAASRMAQRARQAAVHRFNWGSTASKLASIYTPYAKG
ncbi:glycosyltransferase family 4 protein [Paenibacillus koleovorans]|uniref:glycosyltransferase family 4 protein n=1 Tax=Paenibacillus koleovorans TaxID=121608 RepID=UPI000FD82298|nr:glycosyltransferase family 4 protein [Paenibacillus koleovorans]